MLNVAICGLRRGASFARIFPLFDECRLSAVCDADETLLARFAVDLPDVQRFTRFDDLIDTRPDICVIASPVALHASGTPPSPHARVITYKTVSNSASTVTLRVCPVPASKW